MRRREYLDWLRGVAVLLMIAAHLLDSWTREPDRLASVYRVAIIVGSMGTPLFLLLAGVAVGLSAGSKWRRSGDRAAASMAVARRGLAIFALAFLFRLQALILGWSSNVRDLLRVDILNIIGPAIIAAAVLWRCAKTVRGQCVLFALVTAAIAFATPLIRTMPLEALPDAIQAYIVPVGGLSHFVLFPWSGLLFAGASLGVLIDQAAAPERERTLNRRIGVGGAVLASLAFAASFLPSPFSNSFFWTTSPAYFFLRAGLVIVGISAAYLWVARHAGRGRWSPILQLGRTSLFIYWIHVEMIYGLISRPLHRSLSLPQAVTAYIVFTAFMLVCSLAKERLTDWYRLQRTAAASA